MDGKEREISLTEMAALEEELHQLSREQGMQEKEGIISRAVSGFLEKKESRQEVMVKRRRYLFLTILTGWMGGHCFYSRQYLKGMLYLLFFWTGMSIAMSIIDLLVAIPKPVDPEGMITM